MTSPSRTALPFPRRRPRLERLEDRTLPAVTFAVGAGAGGGPQVNVYALNGLVRTFLAYDPAFRGGVRVATADVTGDGVLDVITGAGPGGGPHVKVFDGASGALVREWMAYDLAFTGGVFVAAADLTGDGRADVITGAGAGGGPHVRVFDGATGAVLFEWMAYDLAFTGGVTVAGLSGVPGQVVTGAGPGGGPHVKVFRMATASAPMTTEASFLAYDATSRGGVNVAAGGLAAPAGVSIVTGPASGAPPDLRVYSLSGTQIARVFAYAEVFGGGVNVAVRPVVSAAGTNGIVTGAGPGGGPHVVIFDVMERPFGNLGVRDIENFFPFDAAFTGGVFVG